MRKEDKGRIGEGIYTLCKFVKKAKGQKAGPVQVTRDKSMRIELKDERLERLKGIPS